MTSEEIDKLTEIRNELSPALYFINLKGENITVLDKIIYRSIDDALFLLDKAIEEGSKHL